jgi:hypothetical protein
VVPVQGAFTVRMLGKALQQTDLVSHSAADICDLGLDSITALSLGSYLPNK